MNKQKGRMNKQKGRHYDKETAESLKDKEEGDK